MLRPLRVKIGTRLMLSFVTIVILMAGGYALAAWQFEELRTQQQILDEMHEKSAALLNLNAHLYAFRDRLENLINSHESARFAHEALTIRQNLLDDTSRAKHAVTDLRPHGERDSFLLVSMDNVEGALPAQIDAISDLARAEDWQAIRRRSQNQFMGLNYLISAVVDKVGEEVAEERMRVLGNIQRAETVAKLTLIGAGSFTLLVAATLGVLVTQSITQPLAALGAAAQALARGEFDIQINLKGKDELADLGRGFTHSARQLRELYTNLQESEARFRSLIEHSSDFIIVLDRLETIRYVSPSSERVLGLNSEDLLGIEIYSLIPASDSSPLREALSDSRVRTFEFRYRHRNGEERIIEAVKTNLLNNPSVLGTILNARDITERKRAEDALQEAQAALAHVARVASMGELTASIAHEVSQPLTGIVMNAKAGLRWLAIEPPNLEKTKESLAKIERDGDRAATVVTRIRAFFRKSTPAKERLDINETILETVTLVASELRGKEVALEVQLAEKLPAIAGDRVQLQQVILNLIVNASEAMGGTDGPRELVISTRRDENARELAVSVRDSGPGLDAMSMGRIFEAFYTTKAGGMGMGLAICRSIVEAHGGQLSANSNPAGGATFEFTLPDEDTWTT